MSKPLDPAALDQLFRAARTFNGYLDKPVSPQQMDAIWELMKFGPTSANCLPARLVWCASAEAKEKLAGFALPANGDKIRKAPVTVIIGMDLEFYEHLPELFPHTDARSWFAHAPALAEATAFRNSSLQGAYFMLAARALGLDIGPMSGFNNDAVDEAFFAGTNVRSNFISTLGYGDPSSIFERSPRPAFERFNTII
ncbi:malonic semialdehyde reductase [Aquisediminimonas profunda]|uniref:malonic semialdehyde reductase n=1 Tax=Aquisediminimonas profunda TaxID=1550733 RepID=UPI001C639DF1|nr:malonic semialdehyde reductase [Aquisediminimonas profunda]